MEDIPGREGQSFTYRTVYETNLKGYGQARVEDDTKLEKSLGDRLYKAHLEAGEAIGLDLDHRGYPHEANFMEKIPGHGGEEERREWVIERLKVLSRWRSKLTHSQHYGVSYDICYRGLTISACAWERGKDRKTVSDKLKEAMEIWCKCRAEVRGHEKPVYIPPAPKEKGEFKITRIVVFERND